MCKDVVIVRGLPGAGKSSFVKSITKGLNANQVAIHSTDQYFFSNNRYLFDPKKLSINHEKNQQAFTNSLIKCVPLVICDNTNIEYWQIRPYLEAAKKYGYKVEVISIGLFNNSTKHHQYVLRNNHNIELSVVEAMAKKSQRFNYFKHALN